MILSDAKHTSMSLLTDLYQLTMALGYWRSEMSDRKSVFHLFFRKNPFHGGYTIAAGLEDAIAFVESFHFSKDDVDYLRTINGNDGQPLFPDEFLTFLNSHKLSVDVDAIPEGTVAFPHEPLLRVSGTIFDCQLLETALLNIINFQSLIATKAARIVRVAGDDPVLEFGLRRAQGVDGALTASRAAYVGGCAATSNVLAGKTYGIPVKGTHAHSWVMSHETEVEAFATYANAMPNNCVFLVDTYDTLQGVDNAIEMGKQLAANGFKMIGIRLDSGDLAYLSSAAREKLDAAGFVDAQIVASNDLDEHLVESLKRQGAKINVWGIGTKLVTAFDQPALGGVYKLAALQDSDGHWQPKIKLSEQLIKTSTPGILQVRRFTNSGSAVADMIFNELDESGTSAQNVLPQIVDPLDETRQVKIEESMQSEDLLQPVIRNGKSVYSIPTLAEVRARVKSQLELFHSGIKRHDNPHQYPVGLEASLYELKKSLAKQMRNVERDD